MRERLAVWARTEPGGEDAEEARIRGWEADHGEGHRVQHPADRVGRGEDIAEAVEYPMNAGFVSGQELVIDSGAMRRRKNPKA